MPSFRFRQHLACRRGRLSCQADQRCQSRSQDASTNRLIAESDRRLCQPERRSVVRLLTRVERGAHRHPYRQGDTKPAYVSGFRPHNVHALGTAPSTGSYFLTCKRASIVHAPSPPVCSWSQRGFPMPIRPFLADQAFEPEVITSMSLALEQVCDVDCTRLGINGPPPWHRDHPAGVKSAGTKPDWRGENCFFKTMGWQRTSSALSSNGSTSGGCIGQPNRARRRPWRSTTLDRRVTSSRLLVLRCNVDVTS